MLTSEIKSSIRSLGVQTDSLNFQITYLKNTRETIEKLSEQIKSNVDELNKTIEDHERFDSLAKVVQEEINSKLKEIQGMNQTEQITKALDKIVQKIDEEAKEKLAEVQKKIEEHEEEFKQKICKQVEQINSVLQQLDNGGNGVIKTLKSKIQKLVGTDEDETNGGKLGKLLGGIDSIGGMGQLEWHQVFKQRKPIRNAADVMMAVRNIWFQKEYYQSYVTNAISNLLEIQKRIKEFNGTTVISEIISCNEENIDEYNEKISGHKNAFWKLQMMEGPYGRYKWYLGRIRWLIKHLNSLKKPGTEDNLKNGIKNIVKGMDDIKYSELKQIGSHIGEIIAKAKKGYRYLENTQKMLEYLNCVKSENKEIDSLPINGTSFDEIESTIEKVKSVGETIQKAKEGISQAKEKLRSALQEGSDNGQSWQQRNGKNENMMPKGLDLNGEEVFKEYQIKLEGIKEFKETLTVITPGMSELIREKHQHSNDSDVDSVLEWLEKIDRILTQVSQKINQALTEMQKSYGGYKEKINGSATNGGTSIMSNVESIKKIPGEIGELQSEVRYNIVFLNIAKSVNETLDSVIGDAGKLERMKNTFGDVTSYIEQIKQKYESISMIVGHLEYFKDSITLLNSPKEIIGWYRGMIGAVRKDIRSVKEKCEQILKSISEIKEYLNDLFKISGKIAFGFSKIGIDHSWMPGVLTAHPVIGSILHGIHGLGLPLISSPLLILSVKVGFIMAHLSRIWMKLEMIVGSGLIKGIESMANVVNDSIAEVESSIESVIICFLKCSNKRITENTKESTKRLLAGGGQIQLGTIEKLRFKLYQIKRKRNPELKRKGHINQRMSTNKALLRLKGKVDSVVYLSNLYNKKREKDSMERMKYQEPLVTFTEDES